MAFFEELCSRTQNFRVRLNAKDKFSRELVPREFVPSGIIFLMILDPREILKHVSNDPDDPGKI